MSLGLAIGIIITAALGVGILDGLHAVWMSARHRDFTMMGVFIGMVMVCLILWPISALNLGGFVAILVTLPLTLAASWLLIHYAHTPKDHHPFDENDE